MIYVDTSVALAHLLAEDRVPPDSLWQAPLLSSWLIEHEVWVRLNARALGRSHGDTARRLLERIALLELVPPVLARALDALHLASIEFIRAQGRTVSLASSDGRMVESARALGVPIFPLLP